jgi:uncharacterized protein YjbI with pentapeptide repeats
VAPAFGRSADFAIDKPAGVPCPHLLGDFRCEIHTALRPSGFPGCEVFDCFGAGQQVVQVTFAGASWRSAPELAAPMFAVLPVMRQLHELLWYLAEAASLVSGPLRAEILELQRVTGEATRDDVDALMAFDVGGHTAGVGEVLERVSSSVRAAVPGRSPDRRRADLVGASLRGSSFRGASLRGALLLGVDLRSADLRQADLLGADLRGADLRGADLTGALFVTRPQLTAARGDATTRIPASVPRPGHWAA